MSTSSKDCCGVKSSESMHLIVERTRDSVTEIFTKCRQRVGQGAREAVELAKKRSHQLLECPTISNRPNCKSLNKKLTKLDRKQSCWSRLNFDEIATGILVLLILLMLSLALLLVRSYNLACAYGSGGCLWPMFWGQCQIIT